MATAWHRMAAASCLPLAGSESVAATAALAMAQPDPAPKAETGTADRDVDGQMVRGPQQGHLQWECCRLVRSSPERPKNWS